MSGDPRALQGEDLQSEHWEDATHWIAIYADLIRFKSRVLARVRHELTDLSPVAQEAAATDLVIIQEQMRGYEERLDLWYRRLWELHGFRLDAEESKIYHRGQERRLTRREFQLLQFLLDHPDRSFTATQLLARAWREPALHPEEVRNYVQRIRRIVADLGIPCTLGNRPGRGYALTFHRDS